MNTRFLRFFCLSLSLLWLAGIQFARALEVGQTVTISSLTSLSGQAITTEQLTGKYLIIQVWASWCPYCHKQNLNLQKLAPQLSSDKAVVLALSVDREEGNAKKYAEQHSWGFLTAMMTPAWSAQLGKRRGIPELYVVNPQGRVVQKEFGLMVDADLFELKKYGQ
ncbi:MAG: TlpA disulfide reductase family protein [Alcaligenaceae bacterium]